MVVSNKSSRIKLKTMLGNAELHRHIVTCRRCGKGHAPMDKQLGINEEHKITKAVEETVTDFAQMMPFDEASKTMKKYLGIDICAAMIQDISENVGRKLFEKEKQEASDLYNNQFKAIENIRDEDKKGRLYIEVDGSMVLIKGIGWKEIKLGIVFSDNMIINKNKPRHIIAEKEYVAHLGSAEEFKKLLWYTAVKNGCERVKEVVIIGDGAQWIWNIAQELFPSAVLILDFYHFSEHVNDCAKVIYEDGNEDKGKWIDKIITGIKDGKVDETINSINPDTYKDKSIAEEVMGLKNYLLNNRSRINYKDFEDKGYFIGSGAIESGNKCVIQARLKGAGMRWSIAGAQQIATLRAAKKSKHWDKVQEVIFGRVA